MKLFPPPIKDINNTVKPFKSGYWETGIILICAPCANGAGEPVLRVSVVTWLGNELKMFAV